MKFDRVFDRPKFGAEF